MATKKRKISDLKFDNRNINKGSEYGQSLLEKSIREVGLGRSVLTDKNGVILAGNQTVQKASELGFDEIIEVETNGKQLVVVKRTDLDINSEMGAKAKILDNTVSKHNYIEDAEVMEAICEEYKIEPVNYGLDGKKNETVEDDYEIPDEIETDIVLGDLFEIGEHRLLCGDCLNAGDVDRLLNGAKPDMVYADAPYGIEVVSHSSKEVGGGGMTKFGATGGGGGGAIKSGKNKWVDSKQYSEIIGDETTETAKEFYNLCLSRGFKNIILWGGNYFADFLPVSRCWFVWDKEMTGNFSQAEMAWTSFSKGGIRVFKYLWNGLSREGSRDLEGKKRMHPTQKPVGLAMMIFQRFEYLKSVYDGFLGSGTTMVAAHHLNRKCYGIEIDPKYCQVIIDRMLKLDPALVIKKNGRKLNDKEIQKYLDNVL